MILESAELVQTLHVSIPEVMQVVDVLGEGVVCNVEAELVRQLASTNAHFPVCFRVVLVHPLQLDMAEFLALQNLCLQRVMVCPRFTPR